MPREGQSVLSPLNLGLTLTTIVIWAVTFPLLKLALVEIPPLTLAALRFGLACPMFLALLAAVKGGLGSLRRLT